jgi:hypothetical protein
MNTDRRYAILAISREVVISTMLNLGSGNAFRTPVASNLPPDCQHRGVSYNLGNDCFELLLEHPSFQVVREGMPAPHFDLVVTEYEDLPDVLTRSRDDVLKACRARFEIPHSVYESGDAARQYAAVHRAALTRLAKDFDLGPLEESCFAGCDDDEDEDGDEDEGEPVPGRGVSDLAPIGPDLTRIGALGYSLAADVGRKLFGGLGPLQLPHPTPENPHPKFIPPPAEGFRGLNEYIALLTESERSHRLSREMTDNAAKAVADLSDPDAPHIVRG